MSSTFKCQMLRILIEIHLELQQYHNNGCVMNRTRIPSKVVPVTATHLHNTICCGRGKNLDTFAV